MRSAAKAVNQIAGAEPDIAYWERLVDDLISAGEPCDRERAMVRILKQRCVLLRQSRALLSAEVWATRKRRPLAPLEIQPSGSSSIKVAISFTSSWP